MRSYNYCDVSASNCSAREAELLSLVAEDQKRMERLRALQPGFLVASKPGALFDNTDASARIEGIYLAPERVSELIEGSAPLGDVENQVAGYARILRALEQSPEFFTISASTLLAMHTVLFTGQVFDTRSRYRRKDFMDIVDAQGRVRRVPVSPIAAYETPLHTGALCDGLALAFSCDACETALVIPRALVDFVCIHPFDKGTGRLSRLLACVLMNCSGIDIWRYSSIERLCEQDAMGYYDALNAGVDGWSEGRADYEPFTVYWLEKLHEAYAGILNRADLAETTLNKTARIRLFFQSASGPIAKKDIMRANPDISVSTIENALHELLAEGAIAMVGAGRSAAYQVVKRDEDRA